MKYIVIALIIMALFFIGNKIFKDNKNKKINKALDKLCVGDELVLCNGMVVNFCSRSNDTVEVTLKGGSRARFMDWAVLEINGKKL